MKTTGKNIKSVAVSAIGGILIALAIMGSYMASPFIPSAHGELENPAPIEAAQQSENID